MNILVNEKNNILQTFGGVSARLNLTTNSLFSYIYCKVIKTINLDRNEYSTYFLKKGFSEEILKAQLSAFIDFVRENCKEIYDTLKKENDAYDFNEVLSVYSKCLKENPSKFFGIIALCAQKELEENFRSCVLDNFYKNWIETNNLRPKVLPEVLSDEIKAKIIEISKCDARSVNDAINDLFCETSIFDEQTNQRIALFSKEELENGWQNFCGKQNQNKWKLPKNFLQKNQNKFNPIEFLETYSC